MPILDETHDPAAASWVAAANRTDTAFPIQNLPFGSFRAGGGDWRLGVAIGDQVLDLRALVEIGALEALPAGLRRALAADLLNPLLDRPRADWRAVRRLLFSLLHAEVPPVRQSEVRGALRSMAAVELRVPMTIGGYTDFFVSIHHAKRTARLLRGAADVAANYRHLPIGYNGRASSVIVSGTPVVRPNGQFLVGSDPRPQFGPTRRLDFELEVAAVIGGSNPLGQPVPIAEADDRIFGLCLMNDWSARDIQAFEYQPLGPFLGKSFATTISPWIVTLDALAPFRQPLEPRGEGDPQPPPHLAESDPGVAGFAVSLWAGLRTARMRANGEAPLGICRSSLSHLYWSFAQMVAHHASNGCNLRSGDLIGSGTVSGPELEAAGCLLERTENGASPIALPDGEQRNYLEDGDEIVLDGRAEAAGARSIGFGSCSGVIIPARA